MTNDEKAEIIKRNLVRFIEACKISSITIVFKTTDANHGLMTLNSNPAVTDSIVSSAYREIKKHLDENGENIYKFEIIVNPKDN